MDLALCSDYFCTCEELYLFIAFSTIDSRLTTRDTRRVKAPRVAAHSKWWLQCTYVK